MSFNRIRRFSVKTQANDLGGKIWNPLQTWEWKHAVFVELETADGVVGTGESWCFDNRPDALVAFIRSEVAPHVLKADADDLEAITAARNRFATLSARHGMLSSALSAVDIAIWDIRAQKSGRPLWQVLNPDGPGKAVCYASGGLYGQAGSPSLLGAEMARLSGRFRTVKFKIGGLSEAEDLERVNSVLAALPDDTRLIIDCVYSYTYEQFCRLFEKLPQHRIEAVQSPIPAADYRNMARLTAAGIPVMANEAEYRAELHEELVHRRAVRFLQVAPIACGGISRLRALAGLTRGTSVELSLEVSSTALALTAAAQFAASENQVAHVEYHTIHDVFFDWLSICRLPKANGEYMPPAAPGLGFSLAGLDVEPAFEMRDYP
ncbi:MAG: hypothetical protein OXD29_04405 [Roseovarius sp.]|nr:hypothetical protein [Roseovarius sp.]